MDDKRIFCNGVFDILHVGHLDLLEKAKRLGGFLLVALDSDERVRELKGANRPINTLKDRQRLLRALVPVNNVVSFHTDEELERIIKLYRPDVMVKGSEYKDQFIVGAHLVPRIHFIDRTDDSSTQKIQSLGLG